MFLGLVVALVDEVSQVEPLALGCNSVVSTRYHFPIRAVLYPAFLNTSPQGPGLRSQSVVGLQTVTHHAPVPAKARRIGPPKEKQLNRKPRRSGLSGELCDPEYQVRGQVEKNHHQFVVAHHGVIDFGKALFGYLNRRCVNPKHPLAGKDKSENPVDKNSQVNDREPA